MAGLLSLLLWSLLGVYLAVTVNELYGLWRPNLTALPGEHVFHASWGTARHGSAEAAQAQRYAWKLCVSSRESEITHRELENQCIFSRHDIQLNASTALQFDVALPPRLLRPIVQLQERYTELHDQLSEAAAAGSATAQMRSQIRALKKQLLDSDLFLHSFFYRTEPLAIAASTNSVAAHAAALKADVWHVHTSTRLVARWIVPVNNTRSLLASGAATGAVVAAAAAPKLNENGTLLSTPAPADAAASASSKSPTPRHHLVHYLRPKFHFQFVGEDLSFPASAVPQDLMHLFPRRGAAVQARKFYAPLLGVQDLLLMRREWRRLNTSFLDDVDQAMQANRTGALKRAEGDEGVFTTTPATTEGVSDSQRDMEAAAETAAAAAATAAAAAAAQKVVDSSVPPPLYTSDGILLQVSLTATSLGWFRLLSQMTHSVQMLADMQSAFTPSAAGGVSAESGRAGAIAAARDADLSALLSHASLSQDAIGGRSDFEQMKSLFLDANPWLLGLTFAVSILHLVLDLLAFKNDVKFWRERRGNFVGISARSVWLSAIVRTIIFLYLFDQDSTSSLVLFSQALSLAINLWKSAQILRISFGISKAFPFVLRFGERPQGEAATQSYDDTAMRYLSYIAAPLVLGASLWSLVYDSHKGWYSWVLSSLASAVYVGGFILMTPQLFINYKLKSVAHLPLRVFVYRALNTFIDDLFAFIVPMPWLHRLACFRDDVIFFVYLYQRWIYPVDHSRTIRLEEDEDPAQVAAEEAAAAAAAAAATVAAPADVSGEAASGASTVIVAASTPAAHASSAPSSTLTHRHAAVASAESS